MQVFPFHGLTNVVPPQNALHTVLSCFQQTRCCGYAKLPIESGCWQLISFYTVFNYKLFYVVSATISNVHGGRTCATKLAPSCLRFTYTSGNPSRRTLKRKSSGTTPPKVITTSLRMCDNGHVRPTWNLATVTPSNKQGSTTMSSSCAPSICCQLTPSCAKRSLLYLKLVYSVARPTWYLQRTIHMSASLMQSYLLI